MQSHLPTTPDEIKKRNWDRLDVIFVTGDAHIDHPSFPAALLGRVLEAAGFRVGILSRPDVRDLCSFSQLGVPRLFFAITSGALDSMVANYTALKRRRSNDAYAPGGKAGGRPDRAVTVYGNRIRQQFGKSVFIVAGGLEAGLRRFAHYDFWSDSVRRPLLMDCGADVLVHGPGEGPIVEIARRLAMWIDANPDLAAARDRGRPVESKQQVRAVSNVPGVVYREPRSRPEPTGGVPLPSAEQVTAQAGAHATAYQLQQTHRDHMLWQHSGGMRVIANPPWPPLSQPKLDSIYSLPFTRNPHPSIRDQPVPALEQVRFSITSHRGCFGGCAFCAIGANQGKTISSRSRRSILREADLLTAHPDFSGTIRDVGGPTANMYGQGCTRQRRCERPSCLWPKPCKNLRIDSEPYRRLLGALRKKPGIRHLFVTTGLRTDLAVRSEPLMRDLAVHHTSGLLKTAPEHCVPSVLKVMRKPAADSFLEFLLNFRRLSQKAGRRQYVLPYMMAAHPGCTLEHMGQVERFLIQHDLKAEQCQIFTPTPGTAATVMYATGLDPATGNEVFVERDSDRKQRQKERILHHLPKKAKQTPTPPKRKKG